MGGGRWYDTTYLAQGEPHRVVYLAYHRPYPKGEQRIMSNWSSGGPVEDSDGYSKLTPYGGNSVP